MIYVDSNEPHDLQELIAQGLPVMRQSLNTMGFADYLWHNIDGDAEQLERKKATELMASLDAVEAQLKRQIELDVALKLDLVIEGMLGPAPGGTAAYQMSKDSRLMYKTTTFKRPYKSVMAWFNGLSRAGIQTYWVPDIKGTANLIMALYGNSQKESHQTFSRYIKAKDHVKEYNPYVLTLMGVEGGGAGEEIAKSLIGWYKTPLTVFTAREHDLATTLLDSGKRRVGPSKARQLLRAVGREDIS